MTSSSSDRIGSERVALPGRVPVTPPRIISDSKGAQPAKAEQSPQADHDPAWRREPAHGVEQADGEKQGLCP